MTTLDPDPGVEPTTGDGAGDGTGDAVATASTANGAVSRRRRTLLAVVAALTPIVLAVVGVVALAALDGGGDGSSSPSAVATGQTYTYVIPAGTAQKMRNNQPVADILPEYVELRVGDRIIVENQDDSTHTFGPITVRANETTSVDFINPGIYFGLCTVGTHDSITIQVT